MYKNIEKLSNNKHKIDLISLNNFFHKKGDFLLNNLINDGTDKWVNKEDITKEKFQLSYNRIFENTFDRNGIRFIGDDFPVEWYTQDIIDNLNYDSHETGVCLIRLNSNIKDYYYICLDKINIDAYALRFVPKTLKEYYYLVVAAVSNYKYIIEEDWFPKEYIPQLIKNFPEDRVFFKKYLLKEYISKEVKKLLREYYLK